MTARKASTSERAKQKAAAKHRANGYAIGRDEYQAMWKLFAKGDSMLQISKALGLSYGVVRKYVEKGDQKRQLEPLRQRLARVRQQSMELADRATLQTRVKVYKQAQQQLGNAVAISMLATNRLDDYRRAHTHLGARGETIFEPVGYRDRKDADGKVVGAADPGWKDSVFQALLNAQRTAAQNVDAWQQIVQQLTAWGAPEDDQEFRGWSTDELERFAETGELPDHVLGTASGDLEVQVEGVDEAEAELGD